MVNIPGSVVESVFPGAQEGLDFLSILCCCTRLEMYFNVYAVFIFVILHIAYLFIHSFIFFSIDLGS